MISPGFNEFVAPPGSPAFGAPGIAPTWTSSVVPQEVARPKAAGHALCVIPLDEPWAPRQFAICFRDEASQSAAARLLLAHLQAHAAVSA